VHLEVHLHEAPVSNATCSSVILARNVLQPQGMPVSWQQCLLQYFAHNTGPSAKFSILSEKRYLMLLPVLRDWKGSSIACKLLISGGALNTVNQLVQKIPNIVTDKRLVLLQGSETLDEGPTFVPFCMHFS